MQISDLIRKLSLTGLRPSLRVLNYSLARQALDRRYQGRKIPEAQVDPGGLLSSEQIPSGLRCKFERLDLEILFLASDLARISWEPGPPPPPYALARRDWPEVDLTYPRQTPGDGKAVSVGSEALHISVQVDGGLEYMDPQGRVFRRDQSPLRQGEAWTHASDMPGRHAVFGLGERAAGPNLRGGVYRMWNTDPRGEYGPGMDPLYVCIPLYLVLSDLGGHLIFYENSFPAEFSFAEEPGLHSRAQFEGGMLRFYLIPGPPPQALQRYSELTGRAPLPPRWALGYHQSRWGYQNEADIRQVAAGFLEHDLPLSAIHLDIDYMDGYRVFTIDPQRFSNLAQLAQDLESQGVKLVTILDPGVKQDERYPVYLEGLRENVFCKTPQGGLQRGVVWPGTSVFPDFSLPQARRWWGSRYRRLVDLGVAGFWHDMNEPTSFTAWGDMTLPLATRHDLDGLGGDHRQAHNLYALLMNCSGYEGLAALRPNRRPWILSRSGWAGSQRYAWSWTGDTQTTWDSLRMTIATVINLGLSGQPYSGPDIGGFSGVPQAELYLRWFQMAALMPFFRTHSAAGTAPREPWVFGEPFTSILRAFSRLRCQLLPYLYSLAWEASRTGAPLVRPLFWNYPEYAALWDCADAFLLGDNLLVAPVLREGAASRKLALPPGGWCSFWDHKFFGGPGEIELPAPLERIPLLVRAGSLLPMEQDGRLVLHVYAPQPEGLPLNGLADGVFDLYSDPGDGPASGEGPWRLDRFTLQASLNELSLNWRLADGSPNGAYPFPYLGVELRLYGFPAGRCWQDGREMPWRGEALFSPSFESLRWAR